jgi:thiol:disulfide interchange protein
MYIQEPPKKMLPPKNVITSMSKTDFFEYLQKNTGAILIKFGAEWCGPCKQIETQVYSSMSQMPTEITCVVLDIDEESSFDLYAFLKSKRMVNGVPALLCYKKGNLSWIPDDAVIGANVVAIQELFQKCLDVYSKL